MKENQITNKKHLKEQGNKNEKLSKSPFEDNQKLL